MIDENLILIDKQDESECISNELYRSKKYYIYTLYKIGIYDEEEDSLMIWKALKVNIFCFFKPLKSNSQFFFTTRTWYGTTCTLVCFGFV